MDTHIIARIILAFIAGYVVVLFGLQYAIYVLTGAYYKAKSNYNTPMPGLTPNQAPVIHQHNIVTIADKKAADSFFEKLNNQK